MNLQIPHILNPEKALYRISNLFFIFYLVLSLLFYRERLFGDAAFYLLNMIKSGEFFLVHGRYGAFITQLPAIVAIKCDLSIVRITQIFSVSYVVFYYLIFAIIQYVYKSTRVAFLIVLLLTLGIGHTFFWVVDELSQALAFSILFYACLAYHGDHDEKISVANYAALIVSFSLAVITHPLNLLIMMYILVFDMILRRRVSAVHMMSMAACLFCIIWKKFFGSPYEAEKMVFGLNHIDFDYVYRLGILFLTKYPFHLVLLALVCIHCLRKRKYASLIFVTVAFWGYVIFVNLGENATANSWFFYTEHLYLPLTIIVSLPFLIDVLPYSSRPLQIGSVLLFLFIVAFSLYRFISLGGGYEKRLIKIKNMVYQSDYCRENKFVIGDDFKDYFGRDFRMYWSLPSESIMQTSMDGRPKTLVFSDDLVESIPDQKERYTQVVLSPWYAIGCKELSLHRFPFAAGEYIDLTTIMDCDRLDDQLVRDISIAVPDPPKHLRPNRIFNIGVRVTNRSHIPLKSSLLGEHLIRLSYHWKKDGTAVVWDGLRTPLDLEMEKEVSQEIQVLTPKMPGAYTLVLDIVVESCRWFDINQELPVIVE